MFVSYVLLAVLIQVRADMEKFREEARLTKHQLSITDQALQQSETKRIQLSERISHLEQEIKSYESLKQRSQTAVAGLQKVARESQDQVIQLETRLRVQHLEFSTTSRWLYGPQLSFFKIKLDESLPSLKFRHS
ncbi:unnamed protein product [Echinostoma caproni]|uniref:Endoplasmic reticulum transmembrane protein n=1 Tax=Echinostoma caproni TaxID=27848 RepID=A0A183AR50_9TREM|nr:unnamed protein product [Echinostoma caproni]